ncbi:MAG TPA: sigma-70 family RNA polymerase sigma factor [Mycobacteriales bacterium]
MTEPCVEDLYDIPPRPHLVVLPGLAGEPMRVDHERWAAAWEHRPLLLGLARQRVPSHDAEDVVSEAMLRAATAGDLRDEALRPWLVTTTLRLCADDHRRADRERRRDRRLAAWEPAVVPAPEDDVVDLVQADWLASQVDRLPERQARAVWLRAHGHDIASIAVQMVLPYKTVESLLSRGRHSLRSWAGVAAILGLVGWKTIAKRKVQLHVAVTILGVTGEVALAAARVAGAVVAKSF